MRGSGAHMLFSRVLACTRTVCTLAPLVCEHVAGPAPCGGLISRYNQPPGPARPGRPETAQDGPRLCTFILLVLLVAAAAAAAAWFVRLRKNFRKSTAVDGGTAGGGGAGDTRGGVEGVKIGGRGTGAPACCQPGCGSGPVGVTAAEPLTKTSDSVPRTAARRSESSGRRRQGCSVDCPTTGTVK